MSADEALRVWAPRADRVEVELLDEGRHVRMLATDRGVFRLPLDQVRGRYQLRLDGEAVPDPWAPDVEGVLGPCRRDDAAFAWTDARFRAVPLADAIVYELHVGTFTEGGTFDAAIARLPYLAELGVTHLELMPVATFSGERGWGYDGAALFAPHRAYGGPAGLRRLVDAAHHHGLAVLLDVVYNHLGPIGNFLDRLGPFFRADRPTPWGPAVNLDGAGSDEVRRFFIDNALHWLRRYHLDGLRLDAVHALSDASALPFLEELATAVARLGEALGRSLVLVAESDLNDPRLVRAPAHGGFGLDAQWSDDFHHALHVALTGERVGYYADFAEAPITMLGRALTRGWVYGGDRSAYRGHRHGRPLGDLPRTRLLGYAQNHDQIGNRARGERLSQLVGPARLRAAATLVLTAPYVPLLFMGEEWGASTPFLYFTDHRDPAVAAATSAGRRAELAAFGWHADDVPDPQDPQTFLRSRLRFEERTRPPHAALLEHVRRLIALRRAEPALRDGRPDGVRVAVDEARRTLLVDRGRFAIACNLGHEAASIAIDGGAALVLGDGTLVGGALALPPDGAAVVARRVP